MALKLIFVDDEPNTLKLLKAWAEPLGCEVLTLADSQEAAQRIRKEKFDGAFVDARMPHPDGLELAKLVRTSPSNFRIPIVMLTENGDAKSETTRESFRAGVTMLLGKPLTLSRLAMLLGILRGAMMREKRRYARLPFRVPVTCRLAGKAFDSQSINISESGILLQTSAGATRGQQVELEFVMPSASRLLTPRAQVIRIEAPGRIGLQFASLKPLELESIQRYVSLEITE